jgi:hypothetical protein
MSAIVGLPGRSFGVLSLLLPGPPPALGIPLGDFGGGCQALANLRPLNVAWLSVCMSSMSANTSSK